MSCSDCCCASITGLRAGIHPDYIKSVHLDAHIDAEATRTFKSAAIVTGPIHIVSAEASLVAIARDTTLTRDDDYDKQLQVPSSALINRQRKNSPVSVSLFTTPQWDVLETGGAARGGWNAFDTVADGRRYITTASLTSSFPSWQSPSDLFGYFCDGGLFMEMNAPLKDFGVRVVVNYIDRVAFSPAYRDPVQTLQHYWNCAHPDLEFLEGFYAGTTFESDLSSITPGTGGDNPFEDEGYASAPH